MDLISSTSIYMDVPVPHLQVIIQKQDVTINRVLSSSVDRKEYSHTEEPPAPKGLFHLPSIWSTISKGFRSPIKAVLMLHVYLFFPSFYNKCFTIFSSARSHWRKYFISKYSSQTAYGMRWYMTFFCSYTLVPPTTMK